MLYFGQKIEKQKSLITTAGPILDDLCDRSDENINLNSLCVVTRESPHHMRLFAQAGRRGLLHAGGASAVVCAYAPKDI
jgi:DNA-binding IclR family transcriptional regulator